MMKPVSCRGFQKGFQGVSKFPQGVSLGVSNLILELCVCIKYLVLVDPACGSGSLLLKAEKVLGHDKVRNGFFGQEINITTYNLCRINMFMHDVSFDTRPGILSGVQLRTFAISPQSSRRTTAQSSQISARRSGCMLWTICARSLESSTS